MSARRGDAPGPDWAGLPPAALAGYLARQRWSGARGATIAGARVAAVVPFPLDPAGSSAPPCAIVVIEGLVGGAPTRWQLPLLALPADAEASGRGEPLAVLGEMAVHDATAHAGFRDRLRRALADGETLPGTSTDGTAVAWHARTVGDAAWARAPLPSRVGGAEQSNTSLIYGDAAILKLFRRLEAGPQPDVEIGAALAAVAFAHAPALRGVLELRVGDATIVCGMAQALVPGARDAWDVVVEAARAAARGGQPASAVTDTPELARRLGAATRALHDALAAVDEPDFTPHRATRDDVRRWVEAAATAFDAALAAVAPSDEATRESAAFGEARARLGALSARHAELRARLDAFGDAVGDDAGGVIRHHGDYHLGQVLVGADGAYAIIDFEGEPARPLAERRARHSALRDVAGMLRSFGYAAAAALQHDPDAAAPATVARAADWERAAREAFLAGYFAGATAPAGDRPAYLPATRAHADALLRIFELEKLFYELRYEVRNRPDWLPIPLRGLTALLADDATATPATAAHAARAR